MENRNYMFDHEWIAGESLLDSTRERAPHEALHGAPFRALSISAGVAGESLLDSTRERAPHEAPSRALSKAEQYPKGCVKKKRINEDD